MDIPSEMHVLWTSNIDSHIKLTFSDSVLLSVSESVSFFSYNEAGTKHDDITKHDARNIKCFRIIALPVTVA